VKYLGLDESRPKVREVIEHYRPGKVEGQQGTHFFKGKIGRFRQSYSAEQLQLLVARLGPFLSRMGYPA
jgi:hypothetical protein